MGVVKVVAGNTVKVKGSDRIGTVLSLTPQKTGGRGRPATIAVVVSADGSETSHGVRELVLA